MPKPVKAKKTPVSSITPSAITIKSVATTIRLFDELPDSALIREAQLVQSPKRPSIAAPLPFSGPTLWRKVAAGTFPKPLKLSQRITAWRVVDVRNWINAQSQA